MSLLQVLVALLLIAVFGILLQDAGLPDRRHAWLSLLLGGTGIIAGVFAALVQHVSPAAALSFAALHPDYSSAVGLGYVFLAYAGAGLLAGGLRRDS